MLQIGITGGIGTGKSTVCRIFQQLGIPIYDADTRAKWLMSNDSTIKKGIVESFGKEAYTDNQLNRPFLAKQIFLDKNKANILEKLVHPAVGRDYFNWVNSHKEAPYLLKEAALLFESGSYKVLDKIIVVTAPKEVRIERILKRDPQRSVAEIEAIMSKQLPEDKKQQRADFIISNDGKQSLILQVLSLHKALLKQD